MAAQILHVVDFAESKRKSNAGRQFEPFVTERALNTDFF